jgi:hypothetical protein
VQPFSVFKALASVLAWSHLQRQQVAIKTKEDATNISCMQEHKMQPLNCFGNIDSDHQFSIGSTSQTNELKDDIL